MIELTAWEAQLLAMQKSLKKCRVDIDAVNAENQVLKASVVQQKTLLKAM